MLQSSDISITMDGPSEVVAGTEFQLHFTMNKGDLESFSRFQMEIPAGLKVIPEITSNADFSFSDKKVRMIWLRLPSKQEITFSYKVIVDERLKGNFSIDGQLSYILDNERKSVSTTPKSITILPSPTVDPGLIVDISEFEEKVIQFIPGASDGSENVACIRQRPALNASGSEYLVTLLVSKEDKKKFAKIEETIPPNFTAISNDTKDGIFTFKNNVAKFLWMNLPAESQFTVSYRLIPVNGATVGAPDVKGLFSFLVNEKTIVTDVAEVDKDLLSLSESEVKNLISEIKTRPVEAKETLFADATVKEGTVNNGSTKKTVNQVTGSTKEKTVKKKSVRERNLQNSAFLLVPENGIYYRIQVAAGHKTVDIKRYFKKYRLEKDVKKEEHGGWLKYSIGSFDEYKDARDYRVHIWNTTPINDAFVAAYNNGNRITVQEALMIADQRWYK